MNIKVYGDLYKDHVGFLQILQGVLDSIYTDYYFDFKDNSGYDIFKVRFSYHIITHTEQVILNKEFIRERSMSNSSWMRMKYGLLKSFTADLFKILMFNNDILGNPVGDLSDIINSIRENPKLIEEVAAIKKRFNIKEGFIDKEGIHEYPKQGRIDLDVFSDAAYDYSLETVTAYFTVAELLKFVKENPNIVVSIQFDNIFYSTGFPTYKEIKDVIQKFENHLKVKLSDKVLKVKILKSDAYSFEDYGVTIDNTKKYDE
jgi:hypothetical protein